MKIKSGIVEICETGTDTNCRYFYAPDLSTCEHSETNNESPLIALFTCLLWLSPFLISMVIMNLTNSLT